MLQEIMGKDVMIQRIRSGEGELAEYGTVVKCNLTGYLYNLETKERLSSEPFETLKDQSFQIGEGDTFPGLELALRHSKKGEILTLFCNSRFAYGFAGRNYKEETEKKSAGNDNDNESKSTKSSVFSIPPNTDVEYLIEIISHRGEKELDPEILKLHENKLLSLPEEERSTLMNRLLTTQALNSRKEAGNRWFSYGDYQRAAKAYSRATQISEGYFNVAGPTGEDAADEKTMVEKVQAMENKKQERIPEEDNEIVNLYVNCLNNLAACKLAQKEFQQAKELCTKVLEFSPFNPKALLRAAKASLATDSFEECELCIKSLLKMDSLDNAMKTAAKAELAKLRKAQQDYRDRSKEIQKRIAGKLFNAKQKELQESQAQPQAQNQNQEDERQQEQSQSNEPPAPAPAPAVSVTAEDAKEKAKSSIDSYNSGTAGPKSAGNNMILLLGTSAFVIIFSIAVAVYFNVNSKASS